MPHTEFVGFHAVMQFDSPHHDVDDIAGDVALSVLSLFISRR